MKSAFTTMAALALAFTLSAAEDRCDHPFPDKGCDTEAILQYEREDCTPYHIFLARGSDEPYPGRGGNVTGLICDKLSADGEECSFENIQFPAKSTAWGQDEWCKSASAGQSNGQQQMKDYSEKCPDSKLVLIGFSQGAGVAQTILAGGGGHIFNCDQVEAPSLDRDTAPGKNIVAAVTFGAVIRSKDTPYTVGKGKPYPGQREHNPTQQAAINRYSDVLADYCHYGDGMCAVGSDPEELWSHLNYFLEHNEEVVEWVNKMAKSNGETVSRPGGSGSSTSDSSATSASARPAVQTSSPTDSPKSESSQPAKAGDSNGASGVVVERGSVIAAILALTAVFALF